MTQSRLHRRRFLALTGCSVPLMTVEAVGSQDGPQVAKPRSTDGDNRYEPQWDETLTLTVGPDKADLVGTNDRAIQAGLDYVKRRGGGTVQLLPGKYVVRSSIELPSGVRLRGAGAESVITKAESVTVQLSEDSDWYDQEITLSDSKGFQVGDSVVLEAKNPHDGSAVVIKRRLVARSGNRFKLNDGLRKNLWLSGKPSCSSVFPLLVSERTSDVAIENLTLDGNRKNNRYLNGNYGGCVFLQDCNRYSFRKVRALNYNGDGISFQICHDVEIRDCYIEGNTSNGLHPGSGSQRPVIVNNEMKGNGIGLFWCWGVKYGLAERNRMDDSVQYGISIGHNDTDNIMRDNDVRRSGKVGVLFRDDSRGVDFWPNRNRLERNRIVDSGGEDGIGIDIRGKTREIRIVGNELRETRGAMRRVAVRIGPETSKVDLDQNRITGFHKEVEDLHT